jgi:imidazolonepropionase-like amidohydrolase
MRGARWVGRARWALIVSSVAGVAAWAQSPSFLESYAIVGARIEVGDGRVIEKGTVLVRDGLIREVGAQVTVSPEAQVIPGEGLVVTPGFVDGQSGKGLKLPAWQPDQDVPPDLAADAPPTMREANRKGVRPELRAVDNLALTEAELASYRKAGFTTALLAPSGGTINGVAALVNLSGRPRRECVVRPAVAMGFAFDTTGAGYPASLLGIFAHLRQTLLDARRFRAEQAAFDGGSGRRPPIDDALAALQPALDGTLPVLFEADGANEIQRALRLADEFGLRLIISGGAEAWKVAPLLAKRRIPVLVRLEFGDEPGAARTRPKTPEEPKPADAATPPKEAPPDRPETETEFPDDELPPAALRDRHRRWEEGVTNAGRLQKEGVLLAFTTQGTRDLDEFRANLRRATGAGLSTEAALQALTLNAARIFGVERQMGTVEAGKIANLTVASAGFTDPKSKVRFLFIDGHKFEPERAGGRKSE